MEGAPLPQHARGYWGALLAAVRERVEAFLEAERAQLPLWFVVGFGAGIAAWFALPGPNQWLALLALGAGAAVAGFSARGGRAERALGWFALALVLGCASIWARSTAVAAPKLERPGLATFEARVERVEPLAAKGDLRLTLATISRELPPRVRVSTPAEGAPEGLAPGARVRVRSWLMPPPAMALPGSYDFARDSWFRGIGAVGRAFAPPEILSPGGNGGLDRIRDRLGRHIRSQLPGSAGTIATALATGDKQAVSDEDARAMRRSGLAHLLAVSGLHIGAVIAAAMLLTMKLLALSERLALRFNLVLVAAGVGALTGIGYTLLTGMQVPTVRSCIAALLVLGGIAIGRDAISLRTLAVGALAILIVRPELIVSASFQFSFAAVTAIIALHSSPWGRKVFHRREESWPSRTSRIVFALFMTGLAVEVALAPLALYHFHKAGLYGVAANLVAIPLTTFVIMPFEALALFLDIFGAGAPAWFVAGLSLDLLLALAHRVADAPGAVATIATMPAGALALMLSGGLWLCLWSSRARLYGLVPIAAGAAAAAAAPVPDILVTGDGKHLAVVGKDGAPHILRSRSGDFTRDLLAENSGFDGEPRLLEEARFASCSSDSCIASVARDGRSWRLFATRSSHWLDWGDLVRSCAASDIVVSDRRLPSACTPRWLSLDRSALGRTGGVAIYLGQRPRVETVGEQVGQHPWARQPSHPRSGGSVADGRRRQ